MQNCHKSNRTYIYACSSLNFIQMWMFYSQIEIIDMLCLPLIVWILNIRKTLSRTCREQLLLCCIRPENWNKNSFITVCTDFSPTHFLNKSISKCIINSAMRFNNSKHYSPNSWIQRICNCSTYCVHRCNFST